MPSGLADAQPLQVYEKNFDKSASNGRTHAGRPRYMCVKDPGRPGCGRIAMFADLAEAEARDKILTALADSPTLLPALLAKQASVSAGPVGGSG